MANRNFLPYARQTITESDIWAVADILRSDWLTTGPAVQRFEQAIARFCGVPEAAAVSSGTAALHTAMHVLDLRPQDEVIVPAITFAATANAVVYCGGTPIFADVQPGTLLIDPHSVAEKVTSRTRAIVAVDYAGQPADYRELRAIADQHQLTLVADGCHALGAAYDGLRVGSIADLTTFSFHPVKHITTGEGGMITTSRSAWAERMRRFRNHGIATDHKTRAEKGEFSYEMLELGFNYRLSDFQCALGISQLQQLPEWLVRRRQLAQHYDEHFHDYHHITPLSQAGNRTNAYHLYVVRVKHGRDGLFRSLRQKGISANVHYLPVYLHPYYQQEFRYEEGLCPVAEQAYKEILSLPMFPAMTLEDVDYVVDQIKGLS